MPHTWGIVLLLVGTVPGTLSTHSTPGDTYLRCPAATLYGGSTAFHTSFFPSLYAGLIHCNRISNCSTLNVCPAGLDVYMVFFDTQAESCDVGAAEFPYEECFAMIKVPPPPEPTTVEPTTTPTTTEDVTTTPPSTEGDVTTAAEVTATPVELTTSPATTEDVTTTPPSTEGDVTTAAEVAATPVELTTSPATTEDVTTTPPSTEGDVTTAAEVTATPVELTTSPATTEDVTTTPPSTEGDVTTAAEVTGETAATSPCLNGGTLSEGVCFCPLDYSGGYCERRSLDCGEIWENGAMTYDSGTYFIQPLFTPNSFKVNCFFGAHDAWTTILKWDHQLGPPFAVYLATGVGLNASQFFIGFRNMHTLLDQSSYDLKVSFTWGTYLKEQSADYTSFHVGSIQEMFALTYGTYSTLDNGGNGWPTNASTLAISLSNCAAANGCVGWMNSTCGVGACFFTTAFPRWPLASNALSPEQIYQLEFRVNRTQPLPLS